MRKSTEKIFSKLGDNLIGAEIGVWRGENASSMLQNLSIKNLYLIDSYIEYDDYNLQEIQGHRNMVENENYAKNLLKEYEDKITWIKKMSVDASKDIPNNSLDFVYIDGNHKSRYLKLDIMHYYDKIKKGGVLAGHDFHYKHIRDAIILINLDLKHSLWSYPFEIPNLVINWCSEWKRCPIPNEKITINDLDWWLIKK